MHRRQLIDQAVNVGTGVGVHGILSAGYSAIRRLMLEPPFSPKCRLIAFTNPEPRSLPAPCIGSTETKPPRFIFMVLSQRLNRAAFLDRVLP